MKNLFPIFLFAFIYACANIVPPRGGPKDTAPPLIVRSIPELATKNFQFNRIIIEFDEYITLQNPAEQVLISPPMDPAPDIKVRQKSIIIDIKDTLHPHTTYTINFGESLRDITENNVLPNFRYIFATGDIIDSLSLQGQVLDALEHTAEKGTYVMLYKNLTDTIIKVQKPYYFTKTDAQGQFKIENIAEGEYRIFALSPQNANMIYDLPNEKIAFVDTPIIINKEAKAYNLFLFEKQPITKLLSATAPYPGKAVFHFSASSKDITVNPVYNLKKKPWEWIEIQKDSLIYWHEPLNTDSLLFFIQVTEKNTDTAVIHFSEQKIPTLKLTPLSKALAPTDTFILQANIPIQNINPNKFILSDSSNKNIEANIAVQSNNPRKLILHNKLTPVNYSLTANDSAVLSFFNQINDSTQFNFTVKEKEQFGNLAFSIKNKTGYPLILQLLNANNEIKSQKITRTDSLLLNYLYLSPGSYRIRAIIDKNNSSTWNTGDLEQQKQPERAIYFDRPLDVRANWDLEEDWIIEEKSSPKVQKSAPKGRK